MSYKVYIQHITQIHCSSRLPGYLSNTTDGYSKSNSSMSMNVVCKGKIYLLDMQGKRLGTPEFFSLCSQHTNYCGGVV